MYTGEENSIAKGRKETQRKKELYTEGTEVKKEYTEFKS